MTRTNNHREIRSEWIQQRCRLPARHRRGQSLVEFALISLVLYMLIAAVLTFGHMLFVAQTTQGAVDLAAREISRVPLPHSEYTLHEVLHDVDIGTDSGIDQVRGAIYDQHYLVLNLDTLHGEDSFEELVAKLPLLNQQLIQVMITDEIEGVRVLRYPGAVFDDLNDSDDPDDPEPSGYLVEIPLVISPTDDGVETIEWVRVVEPIVSETDESDPEPFKLTNAEHRGIVALRINYPFQSASMSGFQESDAGRFEKNIVNAIAADDGEVSVSPGGFNPGNPIASDREYGAYAGTFGLGQQAALGSQQLTEGRPVRPFRRVISTQAIYRREIFSN